eukprot:Gb_20736 [translate_table: standard]
MSTTKFNAMVSGLFQLGSAYEWVVTKKIGKLSELDLLTVVESESKPLSQHHHRGSSESSIDTLTKLRDMQQLPRKMKLNWLYRKELALAFLLLVAAARSLLSPQGIHFYFLLFHGISFLIVGLDLIIEQGTFRPGSEFDQLHTEDSVPKSHDGKTTVTAYEDSKSRL